MIGKLVAGVILVLLTGLVVWFELATVPTALAGHLRLSQQVAFVVAGWQVFKLVVLVGGGFVIGHRAGRKGVFDIYRVLLDGAMAPMHSAIANLHRDVTTTAITSLSQTVGKAVLDGTRLGGKVSGVSRVDLLTGLDRLALPPVAGGWEPASSEADDLELYKNNLR